jgi:hypothetical protein
MVVIDKHKILKGLLEARKTRQMPGFLSLSVQLSLFVAG